MKKTISLVLMLALGLTAEVTNADYIFGEPMNLGPTVNTSSDEGGWSGMGILADGLSIFFDSSRPGGRGSADLWITTRESTDDDWRKPVNLGPVINSSNREEGPSISSDGLSLYFSSNRPGGSGGRDIWVATRATTNNDWKTPVNLGPIVNASDGDWMASISADSLSLYFSSDRPGGLGNRDLWITTRATTNDDWSEPVNLGPTVNSSSNERRLCISSDGLTLFFQSDRPGGYGNVDIWTTTRATINEDWSAPVNLGPAVNSSTSDISPSITADGRTLYFSAFIKPGGFGDWDMWQVSIEPVVDLNGDGMVNGVDLSIIADHWGTDDSLCDIGPMPWGDGIVDVQDLIVIAEYLSPAGSEEIHVNEENDGGQIELEQGQILVVTLESNPTTGYRWEQVENQEPYLEQMGEVEFKSSETGDPPLAGAGGWEIFRFKAISTGKMTLQLVYRRPWEEGVEPVNIFSLNVLIH
ncbi:MAG: PD40 domain-containing protein [Planctomycetes bacterium]|nr:PD40 domain-containing protein [Planctomycetota bacterium]MBL7143707.1 PD40 domain-containing protein [Phycisphaerae bacterium]